MKWESNTQLKYLSISLCYADNKLEQLCTHVGQYNTEDRITSTRYRHFEFIILQLNSDVRGSEKGDWEGVGQFNLNK